MFKFFLFAVVLPVASALDAGKVQDCIANITYDKHQALDFQKCEIATATVEWPATIPLEILLFSEINENTTFKVSIADCELQFKSVQRYGIWYLTVGTFVQVTDSPLTLEVLPEDHVGVANDPKADVGCSDKKVRFDSGIDRSKTFVAVDKPPNVKQFMFQVFAKDANITRLV
ncbi:hypothetical protein M3Y98_01201400 [Aphelenchoides besseyi]|nr:hypothetical protein M3Y98_01201400 [Aphelenchoides besseyi]KAI6193111.1 hypothetical protein M3Y96_00983600 [Aphelenchoides besseyi]